MKLFISEPAMTLQDIGLKHQTDKASYHHYLPLYDVLLRNIFPPQRMLEIGIQNGLSLKTWREYFGTTHIVGVDVFDNGFKPDDDMTIIIGDAYKQEMLGKVSSGDYDLIIDDGSHNADDQKFVVQNYSIFLSRDGILIIEDVCLVETIPVLVSAIPQGFDYTAVEMCEGGSIVDSRLFIAWRKK